MKQAGLFLLTALFFSVGFAAPDTTLQPKITLNHIHTVKAKEKDGDELYFDITAMFPDHSRKFHRIPEKPGFWSSHLINKVKNVTLWSAPLKEGEAITVLLSLMEEDIPNINPDDLIGVIRLELKNDKGALQSKWSIPNRATGPLTISGQKGDIQKFDLYGAKGQYDVYLSLTKE